MITQAVSAVAAPPPFIQVKSSRGAAKRGPDGRARIPPRAGRAGEPSPEGVIVCKPSRRRGGLPNDGSQKERRLGRVLNRNHELFPHRAQGVLDLVEP